MSLLKAAFINAAVIITLTVLITLSYGVVGTAHAQEFSYSDCSYIDFDDVDPSTLTLQERIALEEAALFASLDESAECMEKATESAAGELAEAAATGASGAGISGAASSNTNSEANDENQQASNSTTSESSANNNDKERGNKERGSSAVCDAVQEGMASATTEAEKEHFKGLMSEYGCQ